MDIRKYKDLNLPSFSGYKHLMEIQSYLNDERLKLFIELEGESNNKVANSLIEKVEALTDELNKLGYNLHRASYCGSTNYENSEQIYCNKSLNINFRGFSVQITWDKW